MNEERYSRQISLDYIGEEGQNKLKKSKVLIIGCGALGSMIAMLLAGAGVGEIGLMDDDEVSLSNLQRQLFFKTEDVGCQKAIKLKESIKALNPEVEVNVRSERMTWQNGKLYLDGYDFIADATDNVSSKLMVEELCEAHNKYCCIAGVRGFHGQVMTIRPGGIKFGDIFGLRKCGGERKDKIEGVMGPCASLCASLQASEVIKYLLGKDDLLLDMILTFDLRTMDFNILNLK